MTDSSLRGGADVVSGSSECALPICLCVFFFFKQKTAYEIGL